MQKDLFMYVLTRCRGDVDLAARLLFRARNAENPVNFITQGIKERWIFNYSPEEDERPQDVRRWIDKYLYGIAPNKWTTGEFERIGDILNDPGRPNN